mmetsp:Transcript_68911/g.197629  ORF Transcript_68911/g.197629 Transcript_68911/m.197629 type:complete len:311 (+) Transcript_68911:100-1032(+)
MQYDLVHASVLERIADVTILPSFAAAFKEDVTEQIRKGLVDAEDDGGGLPPPGSRERHPRSLFLQPLCDPLSSLSALVLDFLVGLSAVVPQSVLVEVYGLELRKLLFDVGGQRAAVLRAGTSVLEASAVAIARIGRQLQLQDCGLDRQQAAAHGARDDEEASSPVRAWRPKVHQHPPGQSLRLLVAQVRERRIAGRSLARRQPLVRALRMPHDDQSNRRQIRGPPAHELLTSAPTLPRKHSLTVALRLRGQPTLRHRSRRQETWRSSRSGKQVGGPEHREVRNHAHGSPLLGSLRSNSRHRLRTGDGLQT